MLRLFQPNVLDHLPAHQRRRGGRSCASRGGEINEDGAAIARTSRAKRAVKNSYENVSRIGTGREIDSKDQWSSERAENIEYNAVITSLRATKLDKTVQR